MPLMDEFREEREQIKKAPFPQKVQYFKDYYLLPTIFIVFVSVVSAVHDFQAPGIPQCQDDQFYGRRLG